jgi:hypothetical protein
VEKAYEDSFFFPGALVGESFPYLSATVVGSVFPLYAIVDIGSVFVKMH